MLLATLADGSARIADTSRRNEKIALLARILAEAAHDERALAALYLSGSVQQGKLGVGGAQLSSLRDVAPSASASLTVREVDGALERIAQLRGAGSSKERLEQLRALFSRATHDEQSFLARLMMGELRQGALESLLLEAVAKAASVPPERVRRAHMLAASLATIVEVAFREGEAGLARFDLELFRPVQPMLAEPADDVNDALTQLGRAAFEHKLDGARVQVHRRDDEVRIFTRSLQDVTAAVPEIVELVRTFAARELILDGEAIALHPSGRPMPFQETMRRFGRKLDVDVLRSALPLSSFFFDCLFVDGHSLLDAPTHERVVALERIVPTEARVPRLVTSDAHEAHAFLTHALERGHEGVMAKALDAPYSAGARGASWLKIKKAHTLDLVVLAAEWGHGRRTGTLSNLHLGARDPETGGFVMLGKTFKGLTDELLREQTRELLARETHRDAYTVYVRPELVVEIAFNDVQASPQYPGGYALRFARVKRYRHDKSASEADAIDTIRAIYERSTAVS